MDHEEPRVEPLFPERESWLATETFEHLVCSGEVDREKPVDRGEYRPDVEEGARAARDEMKRVVAAYGDLLTGVWPREIFWPLESFTRPDNLSWREPIDLTGPARVLFLWALPQSPRRRRANS